jgi:hypothetical protein
LAAFPITIFDQVDGNEADSLSLSKCGFSKFDSKYPLSGMSAATSFIIERFFFIPGWQKSLTRLCL